MNEQKLQIVINIIPIIIAILERIPKTEDIAKAVDKPLKAALELVQLLSKPDVSTDDANAALDEALAVLALLKAETA